MNFFLPFFCHDRDIMQRMQIKIDISLSIKYNIPMNTSTIKSLREQHGYSQEELAKELGVSRQTISKYENGNSQPKSSTLQKLEKLFDVSSSDIINNKKPRTIRYDIEESQSEAESDIRISIPQRNIEKFKQVFLYILEKVGAKPNIGQTVLYKLLYFIDFDYYELYEEQLMGLSYIKNTYGPTPVEFIKIVKKMQKEGQIEEVETQYFSKRMKKYLPLVSADLSILSGRELQNIDIVLNRLSDKTASEVSHYSHLDVPWIIAEEQEIIEYESVFYRSAETSVRQETE